MEEPENVGLAEHPLAVLHRVSRAASSGAGLEIVLDELVTLTAEATGCDACLVYLAEPESGDFVLRAWRLPHEAVAHNICRTAGVRFDTLVEVSRSAWSDPRFECFGEILPRNCEAALSVPLFAGGATVGLLSIHHRAPRAHALEEIALLTFVGEQIACAVHRHRLAVENGFLREETLRLKRQLELRKIVERAKGILQRQFGLTEDQAYLRLRNESRRLRKPMAELARVILLEAGLAHGREASRAAG
jgi:two-component system, response regulator PdtaR